MTRPRKRILLVCPDEMEASYLSCLLDVRGYYVIVESDAAGALERIAVTRIDLALIELECADGNALVGGIKALAPDVCVILTSKLIGSGERTHCADGFLGKGTSHAQLVERIRVGCARQRGPKKQPRGLAPLGAEVLCA